MKSKYSTDRSLPIEQKINDNNTELSPLREDNATVIVSIKNAR